MNILGIYNGHNATACLLKEGKIVAAISEEKFNNIKNSIGFPTEAIKWCQTFLSAGEKIDAVAVAGTTSLLQFQDRVTTSGNLKEVIKRLSLKFSSDSWVNKLVYFLLRENSLKFSTQKAKDDILRELRTIDPQLTKSVYFVDHHTCHAFVAYHALAHTKEENALIFTLDGYGDFLCATVSKVINGEIKRIAETKWIHSIGNVYALTTKFLGMKMNEHEYKVMGLAPYAKSYYEKTYEEVFKPFIDLDPQNPLIFKAKFPAHSFYYHLVEKALGIRFDNIAASVQHLTEDIVLKWIRAAVRQTGIHNIYCGGGVFMNVKLNLSITKMPEVRQAYFMPSAGDESTPLGAVYYLYKTLAKQDPESLNNLYLGIEYSNGQIKSFIRENNLEDKYEIKYFEDIEKEIAKLLSEFRVVARFKGRSEWGARALGNRSILANPSDMKSFYEVNDQIKCRDFWMPFAPSILEEDVDKYVLNPKKIAAPYMILAFHSTDLAQNHLRAAIHQADKTLRPQIVSEKPNKSYHRLINLFKKLTGIGGVMNTSFNLHGYPLVGTLEQALLTFENSGLEYLALENFLISKA